MSLKNAYKLEQIVIFVNVLLGKKSVYFCQTITSLHTSGAVINAKSSFTNCTEDLIVRNRRKSNWAICLVHQWKQTRQQCIISGHFVPSSLVHTFYSNCPTIVTNNTNLSMCVTNYQNNVKMKKNTSLYQSKKGCIS